MDFKARVYDDEDAQLVAFLRTAGQTPEDEDSLVVQTFPPGHLLHEDGDVGPPD